MRTQVYKYQYSVFGKWEGQNSLMCACVKIVYKNFFISGSLQNPNFICKKRLGVLEKKLERLTLVEDDIKNRGQVRLL